MYVLIVFLVIGGPGQTAGQTGGGGAATTTIEFSTIELCNEAKRELDTIDSEVHGYRWKAASRCVRTR